MSAALNKLFRYELGTFLCVYLDDILVASSSPEVHLRHLRTVFEKLRDANLKLHPGICQFLLKKLRYLGHIFCAEGVQIDPKKTEVVRNFPRPKTAKEVRMFLGMTNFHRRLISNYADKAYGLTKLLRGNAVFTWGDEQEASFQCLKDALVSPPVLALPDFSKQMVLTCDASDKSVSFNLSQVIEGQERMIEYGARGLRKAERNYSICERELLAIISGVQHYHTYISGSEFLIRTDSSALQYLNSMKHVTGRLGRWNLLLSTYKYKVEHIRGKQNVIADSLSRLDWPAPDTGLEAELDDLVMNIDVGPTSDVAGMQTSRPVWEITFGAENETETEVRDASDADVGLQDVHPDLVGSYNVAEMQQRCPDCMPLLEYIKNGVLPESDGQARKIVYQSERYFVDEDLLFHLELPRNKKSQRMDSVRRQLVIPRELQELILKSYHDNYCHIGAEKMYNTIRSKFFWVGMYTDVFNWCKTCAACQSGKGGAHTRAPLKNLPVEATIFERWHMDHVSLPASGEYHHILVLVDSFSLYCVLLATKTTGAEETARLLYDHLFMQYGAKTLLSDRGSAFRSKLVQELCKLLNVKQIYTSSRHPQTNSRAESFNRNVLNSLRTRCENEPEWPKLLSTIGFTFRTAYVKSIGTSPFRLVYGVEPRLPVDDVLLPSRNLPSNAQCYFSQMNAQLEILREAARQNQLEANVRTAATYNAQHGVKTPTFTVGDRVWLHDPKTPKQKLGHKTAKKWVGPFLILEASDDFHVYKLQNCKTQKVLPSLIHANRLRLYDTSRDSFYTKSNTTLHATATSADKAMMDTAPDAAAQQRDEESGAGRNAPLAATAAPASVAGELVAADPAAASDLPADLTNSEWHSIKAIVKHRRRGRCTEYLVQWEDDTTSWLPRRDVTDFAVDQYWIGKAGVTKQRRRPRN